MGPWSRIGREVQQASASAKKKTDESEKKDFNQNPNRSLSLFGPKVLFISKFDEVALHV